MTHRNEAEKIAGDITRRLGQSGFGAIVIITHYETGAGMASTGDPVVTLEVLRNAVRDIEAQQQKEAN